MNVHLVLHMNDIHTNEMMKFAEEINAEISFVYRFEFDGDKFVSCYCTNSEKAGRLRNTYNKKVRNLG